MNRLVIDEFKLPGFIPSTAEKFGGVTFRVFNRPGHSIEIHTYGPDNVLKTLQVFRLGDEVEYSSMWVSEDGYHAGHKSAYTGPIVKITAKTVGVLTVTGEVTKMKIQNFSARNWSQNHF